MKNSVIWRLVFILVIVIIFAIGFFKKDEVLNLIAPTDETADNSSEQVTPSNEETSDNEEPADPTFDGYCFETNEDARSAGQTMWENRFNGEYPWMEKDKLVGYGTKKCSKNKEYYMPFFFDEPNNEYDINGDPLN